MYDIEYSLSAFGLHANEIQVYLAALELGETTIARISKKSKVKRATTYLAIDSLKNRGLLSLSKKGKRTVFSAKSPKKLLDLFDEKRESIMKTIPQLLAISNALDVKPRIEYFEGGEGIKETYKDMLCSKGGSVLEFYSESYISDFDEKFFTEYFTPERVKRGIHAKVIIPDHPLMRKLLSRNVQELRQTKLIDPDKYKIKVGLNIYDKRKVSIISFKEEFGIIIESEIIHDSLRNLFELMWEYAPEV